MKMSFNEKLINLVQQYPIVYDISDQHYYDTVRKENAWEEMSEKLKEDVDVLKKRWTSLRDCFRKALNKRKTSIFQKGKTIKPCKYEEEMSFLKVHFGDQKTQNSSLPVHTDKFYNDNENMGEEINNASREHNIPSQAEEQQANVPLQSVVSPTAILQSSPSTPVNTYKKDKRTEKTTAAHVLQTFLEKKYESPTRDHLRSFFQSMDDVVRTFSHLQQTEVKAHISSFVTKIEMSNARASSTSCYPHEIRNHATQQNIPSLASSHSLDPLDNSQSSFPSNADSQSITELNYNGSAQDQYFSTPKTKMMQSVTSYRWTPYSRFEHRPNSDKLPEVPLQHESGSDSSELGLEGNQQDTTEYASGVEDKQQRLDSSAQSPIGGAERAKPLLPCKRFKFEHRVSSVKKAVNDLTNQPEENEFDIFGSYVSTCLKKLPLSQAFCLREKINSSIAKERIIYATQSLPNNGINGKKYEHENNQMNNDDTNKFSELERQNDVKVETVEIECESEFSL